MVFLKRFFAYFEHFNFNLTSFFAWKSIKTITFRLKCETYAQSVPLSLRNVHQKVILCHFCRFWGIPVLHPATVCPWMSSFIGLNSAKSQNFHFKAFIVIFGGENHKNDYLGKFLDFNEFILYMIFKIFHENNHYRKGHFHEKSYLGWSFIGEIIFRMNSCGWIQVIFLQKWQLRLKNECFFSEISLILCHFRSFWGIPVLHSVTVFPWMSS